MFRIQTFWLKLQPSSRESVRAFTNSTTYINKNANFELITSWPLLMRQMNAVVSVERILAKINLAHHVCFANLHLCVRSEME